MYKGKIVSFSGLRGYGFLSCAGYQNVFFHVRDNHHLDPLDIAVGADVEFEVMADRKDSARVCAVKMQLQ